MKRRDFLKSCGAAAVGLPVLAVGAKSETFEARLGFVPAVVIPEPNSAVHWADLVDLIGTGGVKVPGITSNKSEVTCPICQKWMYHPAPVPVKRVDTLESLAAEFGWELEGPEDIKDDLFGTCWRRLYSIRRNYRSVYIDIYVLGRQMPLREQFVYHTAKNDAFAKYHNANIAEREKIDRLRKGIVKMFTPDGI